MAFDFKHASKEELKKEYDRIASEVGDDQFFTKKELNYLPEVLNEGEQVIAFTSGMMDGNTWLIVLTDLRIIFLDKGMIYGLKQVSISLAKINGISGSTGILFGTIEINDGAVVRKIENVWKKTVRNFTNLAQNAIESYNNPKDIVQQVASQEDDIIAKLEKLAILKEKGILSEEEFQEQKMRILG